MKKYTIAERIYIQRPLVLGQLAALIDVVDGVSLTAPTAGSLAIALGRRLPQLLAAILIPDGEVAENVDRAALAHDLSAGCDIVQALEVLDDFLSINPLSSVSGQVGGLINKIMPPETGSKTSAAS